jgi:predicted nucleic acid-binding protein
MDTSGFIALLHERRADSLGCQVTIDELRLPVFVTSFVIAETHRRILLDYGKRAADDFLNHVYGGYFKVVRPQEEDESEARNLIAKYADKALSFCDALTASVMLRLGILKVFTYDRKHFCSIGFEAIPPILF